VIKNTFGNIIVLVFVILICLDLKMWGGQGPGPGNPWSQQQQQQEQSSWSLNPNHYTNIPHNQGNIVPLFLVHLVCTHHFTIF
jgi:hypothetical protein